VATEQRLATLYATADAAAVCRLVEERYPVATPCRAEMLRRGFNDSYAIASADGARHVFRLSNLRARGGPNVEYETAFLAFLKGRGVPVAEPLPARDGALWVEAAMPEGRRPGVLFRRVPGRNSDPGSPLDFFAQGETLAWIHAACADHDGPVSRYRLDLDHLLRRPLAALVTLPTLEAGQRPFFEELAARLEADVARRAPELTEVACHGDCHGGNTRIEELGPFARRATFFDFDDGGPGWLAYNLAVLRWAHALNSSPTKSAQIWPAFLDGYRSVRPIGEADLAAIPTFVAIRHFWLMGEYASRLPLWGTESLPTEWIERQADFLRRWEETELSAHRLL
jgi:Ser/Thr protein kinase RdoA (MazF antagonist)